MEDKKIVDIRSDLWTEMTAPQLTEQREIIMDRLGKMVDFLGPDNSMSMTMMYNALQQALTDLNGLIDKKHTKKK